MSNFSHIFKINNKKKYNFCEYLKIFANHQRFTGINLVLTTVTICCRYPFNDSEHASLFAKISRGHFVVPECLSSRAKCLIRSLLRRKPCERLTAGDVLLHPWLTREERHASPHHLDQIVPDCVPV